MVIVELEEEDGFHRQKMGSEFLRTKQFLYVIIGLFIAISVGLLIALIVSMSSSTVCDSCPSQGSCEACDSPGCIMDAFQTLQVMDLRENPCDDFYEYTCGKWDQQFRTPDYKSVYGIAERAEDALVSSLLKDLPNFDDNVINSVSEKQAKLFYNTCISDQTDYTADLVTKLTQFGNWPLLSNDTRDDLTTLNSVLAQLIGFQPSEYANSIFNNGLFKIFIRKNENQKNTIYFDDPELGLNRIYLLGKDPNKLLAYKTFITNVAKALNTIWDDADLTIHVNEMIDFETTLARNLNTPEENRDHSWNVKTLSTSEVQDIYIGTKTLSVGLLDVLNELFGNVANFNSSTKLAILQNSKYIANLDILNTTNTENIKMLKSYVMWRYVQFMSWHVGGQLRDEYVKFQTAIAGTKHMAPIQEICAKLTNSLLSFATGNIYAKNSFDIESIKKVNSMYDSIKNVFLQRLSDLQQNGFLNETTVNGATKKMNQMNVLIGRPDWIMDNTSLDNYYKFGDDKTLDNGHFANMQTLSKLLVSVELRLLQSPMDNTRWIKPPVSIETQYDPVLNSITLPMGSLQNPYYMPDSLNVSNYAKLGVLIAREILHGFNVFGHQLNGKGKFVDWWKTEDETYYFSNVTECFVNQYKEYCKPQSGCVDGDQTLDENFADNGAILLAYKAGHFEKSTETLPGFVNVTNNKLFFIQYSSMHCTSYTDMGLTNQLATGLAAPNEYRVKGSLQNSEEFSKAFNCKSNVTVCGVI